MHESPILQEIKKKKTESLKTGADKAAIMPHFKLKFIIQKTTLKIITLDVEISSSREHTLLLRSFYIIKTCKS